MIKNKGSVANMRDIIYRCIPNHILLRWTLNIVRPSACEVHSHREAKMQRATAALKNPQEDVVEVV